jgi:hypothetical protein
MSEVDRLSNSGLYPALPIADKRSSREDSEGRSRPDPRPDKSGSKGGDAADAAAQPRPPKSLIDEYA